MSLNRWAARRDANEPAIVDALEACGFSVYRLGKPADLLLGKHGITRIVEVKTDDGELTPAQRDFWSIWRGNGRIVLRTVDDALTLNRSWSLLAPLGPCVDAKTRG